MRTVDAPAKINLALHVTGRRADGYHLIESLVGFTELGDRLSAGAEDADGFVLEGPEAGSLFREPPSDNLVILSTGPQPVGRTGAPTRRRCADVPVWAAVACPRHRPIP